MPRLLLSSLAAALLLALVPAEAAGAVRVPAVLVRLQPSAQLDGAGAATGRVRVSCPAGMQPLEALVTLSQADGAVSGQGAIAPVTCDGRARWYAWRVAAPEAAFSPGPARASAFVLVLDGTGTSTLSGADARVVRVRR